MESEIAEAAGVPAHHVIVDVPKPPKFREAGLHVRFKDGTLKPLSEASRLVRVLADARMDHWRWWVFAPKQDREKVGVAAERVLGLDKPK
jgi:HD superfamily phosphohydrolase